MGASFVHETASTPPLADTTPQSQRLKALIEVERRAHGGVAVHLPAWLLVAAGSGIYRQNLGLVLQVSLLFILIGGARLALHRHFAEFAAQHHDCARRLFLLLLLGGAAQWGVLLMLSRLWAPLLPANAALQLVTLAVCAAGTMTLASEPRLRVGMPVATLGPSLLMMVSELSIETGFIALMLLLFLCYIVAVSRTVAHDYHDALTARTLLEERAAELERLSGTDGLTQLRNRVYFDRHIALEWARARRSGDCVTVLMVDLDHFKRINDNHGHPFGDRCLMGSASAMQRVIYRPGDLLARYGGEEFVVLLPGTDAAGALTVAARLLAGVRTMAIHSVQGRVPVTCSVGAATLVPTAGNDWMSLLSAADAALYQAKQQGRNRVVAAVPLGPAQEPGASPARHTP
jgi:diguanylate cyclase (GGDEF)-like protein